MHWGINMNNEEINIGKKNYAEVVLMLLEEVDLSDLISNLNRGDKLEKWISKSTDKELLCEVITSLREKRMNNVEKNAASLEKKCFAYIAFNLIA